MRGAGKSHWWAALNSEPHRHYLARVFPEAKIENEIVCSQGFGIGLDPKRSPSKDTLAALSSQYKPRHVWQAVIGLQAGLPAPFPQEAPTWANRVRWVRDSPEEYARLLYETGEEFFQKRQRRLLLFDALDRLADDWAGLRPLASALFQVALDMLGNRGIRLKLFVRPDMLEDRQILAFPDSSKLTGRKADLTWQRADLYALLFQCLANEKTNGATFRDHCRQLLRITWRPEGQDIWVLPDVLRHDEDIQKKVFHALAGPAMAMGQHGHKSGFPHTWLPNHLLDSRGQVSPRSFLAAIRSALDVAAPADWPYALHYKGIQEGVKQASTIRVKEVTQEDYPWVEPLMLALRNQIIVPCQQEEILTRWKTARTLDTMLSELPMSSGVRLLPLHLDAGPQGVLEDLKNLGIVDYISDGRIQIPDVYRIAFGLGRKGGVKPLS